MDNGGHIHIVWLRETTPSFNRVLYRQYVPGEGWSENTRLSRTGTANSHPVLLEQDGNLHVVWKQSDGDGSYICYRGYTPVAGWDSVQTTVHTAYACQSPCVAADLWGNVHVTWCEWISDYEQEIAYRRWTPGAGWDPDVFYVTENDSMASEQPSIACDGPGNVHVVWHDLKQGGWHIWERVFSPDSGWHDPAEIVGGSWTAKDPHLTDDVYGNLHLAWSDARDLCCDVYYMKYCTQSSSVDQDEIYAGKVPDLAVAALPNPFKGRTVVSYWLPYSAHARVTIYDVAGRAVAMLADDHAPAGYQTVTWNGEDSSGGRAAAGVYFLELRTNADRAVTRLVLLR
jgi:hypothetical protein